MARRASRRVRTSDVGRRAQWPTVPPDSQPQSQPSAFYLPELDFLRAFAFLGVFCSHWIPARPEYYVERGLPVIVARLIDAVSLFGADGVMLFFCLSSYLITQLLLKEIAKNGRVDVPAFYARRVLRIWPLYLAFTALAAALPFFDHEQEFGAKAGLAFLLFSGNWIWALGGTLNTVAVPLWSISVGEQFYLGLAVGRPSLESRGARASGVRAHRPRLRQSPARRHPRPSHGSLAQHVHAARLDRPRRALLALGSEASVWSHSRRARGPAPGGGARGGVRRAARVRSWLGRGVVEPVLLPVRLALLRRHPLRRDRRPGEPVRVAHPQAPLPRKDFVRPLRRPQPPPSTS